MIYGDFGAIKKICLPLLAGTFIFLTLFTSGITAVKIVKGISSENSKSNNNSSEVLVSETGNKNTENSNRNLEPTILPTPTPIPVKFVTAKTIPKPSVLPTSSLPISPINTNSQSSNTDNCVITLFGQQYDVTRLRQTHSGGDVFACGADMTTTYQKKHGSNVSMMQPYLFTGSVGSNTQVTQPPPTSSGTKPPEGKNKEEEDDD